VFRKRNVLLLSLGLCALVALRPEGDFLRRLRARHVKETVFVSAGNLRLAGFFDGLTPDPHWDARKALQASRGLPRCGANRGGGSLTRLVALFERTALAQGCGSNSCSNCYSNTAAASCPGCTGYNYVVNDNSYPCQGTYTTGNGCVGTGCTNLCSYGPCDNSVNCGCGDSGGCTGGKTGDPCDSNGECCSSNCNDGTCGSDEVIRRR
jgi:hypothetical protein